MKCVFQLKTLFCDDDFNVHLLPKLHCRLYINNFNCMHYMSDVCQFHLFSQSTSPVLLLFCNGVGCCLSHQKYNSGSSMLQVFQLVWVV